MKIDKKIITTISALDTPIIVAVSGFGGSGKSTFSKQLGKSIDAPVIGVDSFMTDRILAGDPLWGCMDFNRIEQQVLKPFTEGKNPVEYGHFDWSKNKVGEIRKAATKGRLIIEGVGLFRPNLLKYFGFKIWIECPIETAIARGKKRDREGYNDPLDPFWDGIWKNSDLECFEAFKPKDIAHWVVDNSAEFKP